jgi:hypothetical protein
MSKPRSEAAGAFRALAQSYAVSGANGKPGEKRQRRIFKRKQAA